MSVPGFSLEGRVAVVTGAASGIGRASAVTLARAGADVAVADLDADGLAETAREVEEAGRRALTVPTDVGEAAAVEELVDRARGELGRLDVMCNIAGIMHRSRLVETTEADLDRVLRVNLKGAFFGTRAALRAMLEQGAGGSIVNMASGAIDTPADELACYAMSKAAVTMLTRTAAVEGGPHGVRVNAVAPGFVATAMTRRRGAGGEVDAGQTKAVDDLMAGMAPLRRIGQPEDIAAAVLYLASDASGFMTGQILRPNGGVAMPW